MPPEVRSCPAPEVLVSFLAGTLTGVALQDVAEHVKTCSDCVFVLGETNQFLQEESEVAATEEEPPPASGTNTWSLAAAASLIVIAGAVVWLSLPSRDPIGRMTAAAKLAPIRPIEGQLSDFSYARFEAARNDGAADDRLTTLRMVAASIADDPDLPRDASAQHARGVAELLRDNPRTAIALLAQAAKSKPSRPDYWSDLAAARIAFARAEQDDAQLRAAITDAGRALALDPRSVPALFNRAVASQHLGRGVQAVADFRSVAAIEPQSRWAEEALLRAGRLAR